ncbi:MAG: NYN domain-containing protein [Puniceicoccales bacterium]|jgi:predicted RNA-binding protein with PIN domain|nr:NYN domain-containing protein [Puniceicoccales bacterium]
MMGSMQQNHWILDGYNVMHALGKIHESPSFEVARALFVAWLGQFQSQGDKRITVVFDSNVTFEGPQVMHPRIHIIYSPQGFNADGTILMCVRQANPETRSHLTVVTRDRMLRDTLFAYNCVVVSPEAFFKEYLIYQSNTQRVNQQKTPSQKYFYKPFQTHFDRYPPKTS